MFVLHLTGKSDISIILCLSTGSETCSKQLPGDVQKIVDTYQLSPFIAKVSNGFIVDSLATLSLC